MKFELGSSLLMSIMVDPNTELLMREDKRRSR